MYADWMRGFSNSHVDFQLNLPSNDLNKCILVASMYDALKWFTKRFFFHINVFFALRFSIRKFPVHQKLNKFTFFDRKADLF